MFQLRWGLQRLLIALRHPARLVVVAFGAVIAVGVVLLSLPVAHQGPGSADAVTAVFTATSAVCVTGLIVVDTPGYWSMFGEVVILGLIKTGGLGIMTLASLLGLLVARRLPLRMQLSAQTETKSLELGEVRQVVRGVVLVSLAFESVTALALTLRLWSHYTDSFGRAVYLGVFHSVSAFNNAGFALYSTNLERFVTDPWICLPIAVAVITGGLGFPVLFQIRRMLGGRQRWTMHTKVTLGTTFALLALSSLAVTATEWANPDTLGRLGVPGKLLAGFFQAVVTRTAGFNTVDIGQLEPATLLSMDIFMFIGGGSAGTAGGIKVTTFALLAFVIWAEIRGEPNVTVLGRRLPGYVQRQALTIALLGVAVVVVSTLLLLSVSPFRLDQVLFESVSAFGTVGLSTGITAQLPTSGILILTAEMFIGRLGPVTLATALALRDRVRRYELPEERPIVG